jgi:hypothetical protein
MAHVHTTHRQHTITLVRLSYRMLMCSSHRRLICHCTIGIWQYYSCCGSTGLYMGALNNHRCVCTCMTLYCTGKPCYLKRQELPNGSELIATYLCITNFHNLLIMHVSAPLALRSLVIRCSECDSKQWKF